MSEIYQSIPFLVAILMIAIFVIAATFFLRSYLWWLLGIGRQIEQNDEIILLLKYIAAGKQIADQTEQIAPPQRSAINPLTKQRP